MYSRILKRVGGVLLAIGIVDGAVTIARFGAAGPYLAVLDGIAIVCGVSLFWGGPRMALWVRSLAVFLLGGGIVLTVSAPLFQPLSLTVTELRLDPGYFAAKGAIVVAVMCISLWVTLELGRPVVQDAIVSARIRRWDMRIPAQAGGGIVALAAFMLWLALHGQSASLATALALQQLGPDYRYHLSWISSSNNGHGTSVTGVVTAWNATEVRKVLLHWETR